MGPDALKNGTKPPADSSSSSLFIVYQHAKDKQTDYASSVITDAVKLSMRKPLLTTKEHEPCFKSECEKQCNKTQKLVISARDDASYAPLKKNVIIKCE